MNVQSVSCQPIRPVCQLNTKPAFGDSFDFDDEYCQQCALADLKRERIEMEELAQNKDSKFLSSVGTLGLGVVAGALSFATFKTMAPKGAKTLKTIYSKIANLGFVKKTAEFVKKYARKAGDKIKDLYNKIKPESKLGKVKKFLSEKVGGAYGKVKTVLKNFAEKHNLDKAFAKKAANNTGATLVAIPAATTAINSSLAEDRNGGLE